MTMLVEDGSGLLLANSYASEDTFSSYCDDRAYTIAEGDVEAALIRGSGFVDSYRSRFPGYRAKRRLQGMEWPRVGAYTYVPSTGRDYAYLPDRHTERYQDYFGYSYIAANEIPIEVIRATCEAALRELTELGSMLPDLDRGGEIDLLKAGSVEIKWRGNAPSGTVVSIIDGLLSGLLLPANGGLFGTASRG